MRVVDAILRKVLNANKISTVGTSNESVRVEWLKNTLNKIPAGGRILDAGAGEQQFKGLCSHLTYISQDFAQYNPQNLDEGLQMNKWDYGKLDIISDIANIPEPASSFDAIMCTEVFEHIINPRDAIKEFSRLLKPKGYLIITAPFASLTHFAPHHYYTGFSNFFYEKELPDNLFKIIDSQANGNYFEFIAQELRRVNSIASKYSADSLTNKELIALDTVLNGLQRFSGPNNKSSELLNFGFHVFAQKL